MLKRASPRSPTPIPASLCEGRVGEEGIYARLYLDRWCSSRGEPTGGVLERGVQWGFAAHSRYYGGGIARML